MDKENNIYQPSPPYYNNNDDNNNNDNNGKVLLILLLLIFYFFVRCWWEIQWNSSTSRYNKKNMNENLLNKNIEKKEIKFTNELYDKECTICLEDFNENEILYELICKHHYHKDCIDDWLSKKNTCPLCRLNLI